MKKAYRIRKNEEFSSIIQNHYRKSNDFYNVYYAKKQEDHVRVGISVSKKVGNAVVRNKIKRQIRMMCLDLIDFEEGALDYIIVVKKDYLNNTFQSNLQELKTLLKKCRI
ncbi:MAG: ribonuclease P protein component [Erysipelotrichaceae bacterium]|nr:ribonuclease P protein component [Erysipelotrichaceae bacterium]